MRHRSTAVVFLARGHEDDHLERFQRFLNSYRFYVPGEAHNLYVIFKGYHSVESELTARLLFEAVPHIALQTDDLGFDLGAYAAIIPNLSEDFVCFLNSHAEILSTHWLSKLISNLDDPAVGMVSATGSYESLHFIYPDFPRFPNPHLRTNAFALRLTDAHLYLPRGGIRTKLDSWRFESGAAGLTQRLSECGRACLVIGRDGCGYGPDSWPNSETYRQGLQSNLIVDDNVTRMFNRLTPADKKIVVDRTWGISVSPTIIR